MIFKDKVRLAEQYLGHRKTIQIASKDKKKGVYKSGPKKGQPKTDSKKVPLSLSDIAEMEGISLDHLKKAFVNIGVPLRERGRASTTDASNANDSGKILEGFIKGFCSVNNIPLTERVEYAKPSLKYAKLQSVGRQPETEFQLSMNGVLVNVECKNQSTAGSAEEKIFYTHWVLSRRSEPGIIVICGEGWSAGWVPFIQAELSTAKVRILTLAEFLDLLVTTYTLKV